MRVYHVDGCRSKCRRRRAAAEPHCQGGGREKPTRANIQAARGDVQ